MLLDIVISGVLSILGTALIIWALPVIDEWRGIRRYQKMNRTICWMDAYEQTKSGNGVIVRNHSQLVGRYWYIDSVTLNKLGQRFTLSQSDTDGLIDMRITWEECELLPGGEDISSCALEKYGLLVMDVHLGEPERLLERENLLHPLRQSHADF